MPRSSASRGSVTRRCRWTKITAMKKTLHEKSCHASLRLSTVNSDVYRGHHRHEKNLFLILLTCKKNSHHSQNDKHTVQSGRGGKRSTVLSKRTAAVFLYSTVGSDAMHHYRPGTAIGSTGGSGSARNQRERLRALPRSPARPALGAKRTSQLIIRGWTRPTQGCVKLLLF